MPTFPQSRRMKAPAAFDRAYARRKSASDAVLIVYAVENGLPHPRLGCSVSRKVGGAVVRNRHKRLFREAFRLEQDQLPPGVDLVLIPRPGGPPTIGAVRESLVKLARQAARKLSRGVEESRSGGVQGPAPSPPLPDPSAPPQGTD